MVTLPSPASGSLAPTTLAAALEAGDIAAVILPAEGLARAEIDAATDALQPVTRRLDVAFLIGRDDLGDLGPFDKARWDGVEVGDAARYATARRWAGKDAMIGVLSPATRDDAMAAAELDADYVRVADPEADLVAWWGEIMTVPLVASFPTTPMSVGGLDFLALEATIWSEVTGPVAAVARAQALIDELVETPAS